MNKSASYRIFLSGASGELASYRQEIARVLRRKGIEVRDQEHFRDGGATLLETLNEYIEECDAIICLIGDQCGSLPTDEHMTVMGDGEWVNRFRDVSGQQIVSYTQWEFLLAKSQDKAIYVYLTDEGFVADKSAYDSELERDLQSSYRDWVKQTGKHWAPLTTTAKLIEDILVLPFPDLLQGTPNILPFPSLGSLFKGREQFLQELYQQLNQANQGTTVITDKAHPKRARAVHGSGGIGKTRTAIEYAWRNASHYNALLFLSAQTPELLQSSLAGLTKVLPITGMAQAPDDQRIDAALNWLETNPGWILILDNVDTDEAAAAVKTRLPQLTQGHVLITSRLSQWSAGVKTLDLSVLDLTDATDYLLEATETNRVHTDQDADIAEQIALKAGQLALGLEHAAAFINARYLGFDDYLAQWELNEAKILETFDLGLIEYPHELLVTWKLSVDQLDDGARQLLEVLSWLSPEAVPDTYFRAAPDEGYLAAREAIATLCKYSLANRVQDDEQRGFQIHRLVQATTRYHQQKTEASELPALDKALAWTHQAYQGDSADVRNWPMLEPLAEHVEVLCQFADQHGKTGEATPNAQLLNDLALLYFHKARHAASEPLMRRALQINEHSYGEDHPEVATLLNNLAGLLQATNRLSEAEPLMCRALQINEHSYGEDHPEVATLLNNLAQLLQDTNRQFEAEPLMRRALQINEHNYGEDHPKVATLLNNLAQLLQATNQQFAAEPLMRRALQIDEHSYGEDHPTVARDLNNLAQLQQATNRLSEAEPLMRRALQIDKHSYGEDHPRVAIDLNNLAQLLKATNRLSEAEPMMRRALQIDEHNFAEDHPRVAVQLSSLASLLKATNRLSEAEPLMRQALQIDEHSFGEDHPTVAIRLNNLASLLLDTNRLSEAEQLMRRALQIDEHSYGEDHPTVAIDLNNLAQLLKATNRLSEAEPLMRRALQIDEHSFAEDHPRVAIQLSSLASMLKSTNRLSEAEPLMRRALQIDEHSYGEDHPKVALDLNNLAQLLKATNRLSEAEPLMRRMIEILHCFSHTTGHQHPHMKVFIKNYENLLTESGLSEKEVVEHVQEVLSLATS